MSDLFGLDCHERIGHSWVILGLNRSKYYFCQESTKFDRLKALIADPMRFRSAGFQNERWLSGLFRGKSQAITWQSGIVWSPFQVYRITLIPHKQQAETIIPLNSKVMSLHLSELVQLICERAENDQLPPGFSSESYQSTQ
jgi:hypothetical protein